MSKTQKELDLDSDTNQVDWVLYEEKVINLGQGKSYTQKKPTQCVENTSALLNHYGIEIRYNEMSKEREFFNPLEDLHRDTKNNTSVAWIENKAILKLYKKTDITDHLSLIGSRNSYHPVRDWIKSKQWDGQDRLGQYYETVESQHPLKEVYLRKWAIMAVAAVMEPDGIMPQGCLVFSGKQGIGKTRWLNYIANNKDWIETVEHLDVSNKDSVSTVVSRWIVELGEIQSTFRKQDLDALKGFITKSQDTYRAPYDRSSNSYARRTVFFGTVDQSDFLVDKNGNRRWWTIDVDSLNQDKNLDIQQLWAQVYTLYLKKEPYWMSQEEIALTNSHTEQFMVRDPIDELMEAKCHKTEDKTGRWFNATTLLMQLDIKNPSVQQIRTCSKWLKKKGFQFKRDTYQYKVAISP